jgi:CspA family cold shock protein
MEIFTRRKQMTEIKYGTVVWFSNSRGYGYLAPDDGGKDFFIHYTQIITEPGVFKTLVAGQKVSFVIGANKNGPQAEKVVVIAEPKLGE